MTDVTFGIRLLPKASWHEPRVFAAERWFMTCLACQLAIVCASNISNKVPTPTAASEICSHSLCSKVLQIVLNSENPYTFFSSTQNYQNRDQFLGSVCRKQNNYLLNQYCHYWRVLQTPARFLRGEVHLKFDIPSFHIEKRLWCIKKPSLWKFCFEMTKMSSYPNELDALVAKREAAHHSRNCAHWFCIWYKIWCFWMQHVHFHKSNLLL